MHQRDGVAADRGKQRHIQACHTPWFIFNYNIRRMCCNISELVVLVISADVLVQSTTGAGRRCSMNGANTGLRKLEVICCIVGVAVVVGCVGGGSVGGSR